MPGPRTCESSSFDRAFSLIELIVALGLMGIMAGIAVPNWNRLLPYYQLNSSARQLQSELNNIKMRAATENTTFHLVYAPGGSGYTIQKGRDVAATKSLPEGVMIANAGMISFSPRGTAAGNRVRLRASDGACKQVIASPTGRVRVCSPSNCVSDC
jgi:prepilin-type N-terminal cleavage/methylation domain-containing protein